MTRPAATAVNEDARSAPIAPLDPEPSPQTDAPSTAPRCGAPVGPELSCLRSQRRSPAATETAQRPRLEGLMRDGPRTGNAVNHSERRAHTIEVRTGLGDFATIDIETTDETVIGADAADERAAPNGVAVFKDLLQPMLANSTTVLPPQVSIDARERDGSRRRSGGDGGAGDRHQQAAAVQRIPPVVASMTAARGAEPILMRRRGLRLIAAVLVLGITSTALSLFAFLASDGEDKAATVETVTTDRGQQADAPPAR
jgi:hypothetical protein